MKSIQFTALACCLGLLAGCSGNLTKIIDQKFPGREAAYKTSKEAPSLAVPPGLSGAELSNAMVIPGGTGSTTYSQYRARAKQPSAAASAAAEVLPATMKVRLERAGGQRWLVVQAPPGQVWDKVRQFWLHAGFELKEQDPALGLMVTNWSVNQADLPKGFLAELLTKVLPESYVATTQDQYRTRLEHGHVPGTTEVYVTQRGMEQVSQGDTFVWQPRPSDPGLVALMLRRMMVFMGVKKKAAERTVASGGTAPRRALLTRTADGQAALTVYDGFPLAWQRTGVALGQAGFTVEDRDRSRGLYFIRYIDPDESAGKSKGWLSKLEFWKSSKSEKPREEFMIALRPDANAKETRIEVLNRNGRRDTHAVASRILGLLYDQLK